MSKFRIVKTTAAKVHTSQILLICSIDPNDERFLVQKKKLFGWETISTHWVFSDAEKDVLYQKGVHPSQIAQKKAREKPDEVIGEY